MCDKQTIIGREGVEDAEGEYTGEYAVLVQCNATYADDCGWRYRYDNDNPDWFITSAQMNEIHEHHQAGTQPGDEKLVDLL